MKITFRAKEHKFKQATLRLVAEEGFAGVKMGRVAKLAELAPSMIYTYFKNKEDLLYQIFRDCIKNLVKDLTQLRDDSKPYKARVYEDFKNVLNLKLSKSMEYNFFTNYIKSPFFKEDYHNIIMQEGGMKLIQLFLEGQEKMIVKDHVNVFLIMALFDGFTDKLVEFHRTKRIELSSDVINDSFSLLWDSIRQ